jgi:hypothetical protein
MADDDKELLTYDEAVALLPDDERIHTFVNPAGMLIGADWDRSDVLSLLETTDLREVAGPAAQSMGHGLVAWRDKGPVFIQTRTEAAS